MHFAESIRAIGAEIFLTLFNLSYIVQQIGTVIDIIDYINVYVVYNIYGTVFHMFGWQHAIRIRAEETCTSTLQLD